MSSESTERDESRRHPAALIVPVWLATLALLTLAVSSVLGYAKHLQAAEVDREIADEQQAALGALGTRLDTLDETLSLILSSMASSDRTMAAHYDRVVNLLEEAATDAAAWECVHAWTEVFALEGFDFDALGGSGSQGEQVLGLLNALYAGCRFTFE